MRRIDKTLYPLSLLTLLLFSCGNSSSGEGDSLTIAVCDKSLESSAYFLKQYAAKNPNLKIELDVYDCDSLKYKLRHGRISADAYILDDLSTVDAIEDKLLDLTENEALCNYSRYVKNFIHGKNGKTYCLPSPGSLYSYCVNLDLLKKYNVTIPQNIDELIEFSNGLKDYVTPFVSSFSDSEFYLDAFMQACIPSFFATAWGNVTFENFINGTGSFASSKYVESLSNSIQGLYKLRVSSFFNHEIGSYDGIEKFFNSEAVLMSISPDFDFESAYAEHNCSFNYAFVPLMGRKKSNDWVCSMSDSYLAIPSSVSNSKSKTVEGLLRYYASSEGQQALLCSMDGYKKPNRFSFTDQNLFSSEEGSESIVETISQGRVFLLDHLYSIFSLSTSSFEDYALDKISVGTVISNLDSDNELRLETKKRYFEIPSLSDVDEDSQSSLTKSLRSIASSLKSSQNLDALFVESSLLKEPIYQGTLYESEISLVLNDAVNCTQVSVKGSTLKQIADFVEDNNEAARNGSKSGRESAIAAFFQNATNVALSYPSKTTLDIGTYYASGVSVKKEDGVRKYLLGNGSEIKDEQTFIVGIPSSFVRGGEFEFVKIGGSFNCLSNYIQYLEKQK